MNMPTTEDKKYKELLPDDIVQDSDYMEWENMVVLIVTPSRFIGKPVKDLPLQRDSWSAETFHPRRAWRRINV